ncbi:uncharacterized protein LOC114290665 [Camellia sinensis]|uniref:uncharacterized protein LOC114290665 n=1 Tax=Camellia sinensis TaxID=4442 RepID=UPI0010368CD7|nr:uncharacterized protein LOC114290665 [Camellia sinensis]
MAHSWGLSSVLLLVIMKILSWNIRGLGRQEKRRMIKKIIRERKIDIALFQETKKAIESNDMVRSLWTRDKMEYMVVNSDGLAGGLLCIWDPGVFQVVDCCSSRSFILLSDTLRLSIVANCFAVVGSSLVGSW